MSDLYLILTAEQAADFSGPTAEGSALAPIALEDGVTFVLPVAVLDDPAHAPRHGALAGLPLREVDAGLFRFVTLPAG